MQNTSQSRCITPSGRVSASLCQERLVGNPHVDAFGSTNAIVPFHWRAGVVRCTMSRTFKNKAKIAQQHMQVIANKY